MSLPLGPLVPELRVEDADESHMVDFSSFLHLWELEQLACTSRVAHDAFQCFRDAVGRIKDVSPLPLRFYNNYHPLVPDRRGPFFFP